MKTFTREQFHADPDAVIEASKDGPVEVIDTEGRCVMYLSKLGGEQTEEEKRIAELEAEADRYEDFVDRINAEVADLRSLLALARRGTKGDFCHIDQQAQRIAELEAENERLRERVRQLDLSNSMACENPCGSCGACDYADEVHREDEEK